MSVEGEYCVHYILFYFIFKRHKIYVEVYVNTKETAVPDGKYEQSPRVVVIKLKANEDNVMQVY